MDRVLSAGAHGTGESEQHAVGGYQPHLRCPQVSVLGPLLFIVTVDSLSKRLNCIPGLKHGFFADDLTFVCTSAGLSEIQQTIQQRLDCITNWSAEYHMEVSAEKTEYMLFVARETNLLSLKVGETALKECVRRSCSVSPCNRTRAEQACAEHEGSGRHAAHAAQSGGVARMGSG
ncbi:putative Reverse transcriptase (RNA dependent DNA polymerase) [Trypanosoma vivax]|nr:putative Reverse transcriptase (RNA dependent DNA polymerase) [Trypanosoma vivax]